APPFRNAEFDIMFDHGISWEGDLLDLAGEDGLIEKSGAWIIIGDTRIQGREKAKDFLRENPKVADELRQKILAKRGLPPQGNAAAEQKEEKPAAEETPAPTRRGRAAASTAE